MKKRFLAILLGVIMIMSDVTPALAAGSGSGFSLPSYEESADTESADSDTESADTDSEDPDISGNEDPDDGDDESEDDDSGDKKTDDKDKDVSGNDDDLPGDVSGNDEDLQDDLYTGYPAGGARKIDEHFQSATDYPDDYIPNLKGTYPAKYIPSNLPDLRNQSPYDTCWSFAAISLAEINLMKKGIYSSVDLSELHLDYFSYNPVKDPLGGLDGDRNAVGEQGKTFMSLGGNVSLAGYVLASWTGAADESRYPYTSAPTVLSNGLNSSKSTDDKAHLVSFYEEYISSSQVQIDSVKQLITDYGAVGVHMNVPMIGSYADSSTYLYNSTYNSFYNPNNVGSGHAVAIVGWDDDFSASKFSEKPQGNGAWLIRNSWTTGSFNSNQSYSGYFWLSYYEESIQGEPVCAYEFTSADNYDNNYQYDGSMSGGATSSGSIGGTGKFANIFTAHSSDSGEGECVKSASFYTPMSNASYSVKLYTNLTDPSNPTSGTLMKTVSGTTTYAGYQNVTFGEGCIVEKNEKFSIVVTLSKAGELPCIGVEGECNSWYISTCSASAGQSFCFNNGSWVDYGAKNNANIRIKAFTDDVAELVAPTSIAFVDNLSETNPLTLGFGFTHKVGVVATPSNASKKVTWSSSAPSIATVDSNGLITAGETAGSTIITATSQSAPSVKAKFKVNVTFVASSITVSFESDNGCLYTGEVKQFNATPTPEDAPLNNLTWTSSDPSIVSIDSKTGIATANSAGEAVITATSGTTSGVLSVEVYPAVPEVETYTNDDNSVNVSWNASVGVEKYTIKDDKKNIVATIICDGSDSYSYVIDAFKDTNPTSNRVTAYSIYATEKNYTSGCNFIVEYGPLYTITYDVGEGVNNPDNPTSYKCGRPAIRLKDPTPPTGYTFTKWTYIDGSRTYTCTSISNLKSDRLLTANYNPITYYIDYDKNADDATGSVSSTTCKYDTSYTLTSCYYSRPGFWFRGWNTKADGTGTTYSDRASVKNLTSVAGERITLYAQWRVKTETVTVNVTFDTNGGSSVSPATKQVTYGEAYGELPIPERSGCDFAGWYTAASDGTMVEAATIVTDSSAHTLYAHWTPLSYTVSFNAMGGTVNTTSKRVTFKTAYGELPTATHEGYTFSGWYTDPASGKKVTSTTTYNYAYDTTLYARWKANNYTVTYDANGGSVKTNTKSVTFGSAYGTLTVPTRAGYDFAGWVDGNENAITEDTIVSIASDHTLTATWTPRSYTLSFNANGGDALSTEDATKSVRYMDPYGVLPVASRSGFDFDGWFTAKSGGNRVDENTVYSTTSNVTVYAHWTVKTYTVSFDSHGGSAVAPITVTYLCAYGTLPTPTKDGYTFAGWYTDSFDGIRITASSIYRIEGDSTLHAYWTANRYKVTFDPNGGSVGTSSINVTYGGRYGTLPVPTKTGLDFVGWKLGDVMIDSDSTVSTASDHTLVAVWTEKQSTLIFDVNGGNPLPENKATKGIAYGQAYGELPVPSRTGYDFDGWYTAAAGGNKVTAETVCQSTTNVTIYAHWTPRSYTLTFDGNGGTPSSDSKTVTYTLSYGELPEATLEGYTLTGWYTDPVNGIHVTAQDIYSLTDDSTLYAHWSGNRYKVTFDPNGGSVSAKSKDVTYGGQYGPLPVPTKIGFSFAGWKLGDTMITSDSAVNTASAHTLVAVWTGKQSTLIFDVNGGNALPENKATKQVIYGQAYGELPVPTKNGYDFDEWYTAETDGNKVTADTVCKSTSNVTIYAHWTPKSYTLSFNGNGGTPSSDSKTVTYTLSYGELPTATLEGYSLTGWYTDPVNGIHVTAQDLYSFTEDSTLYAHWQANTYTVGFNANTGTVDTKSKTVTYNSAYGELPVPEKAGKDFLGWFTEIDGGTQVTAYTVVSRASDHALYAHWGEKTGWVDVGRKRYYVERENRTRVKGWQIIDGKTFYFDESNAQLKTGWFTADGNTYYLNPEKKNISGEVIFGDLVKDSIITVAGKKYFVNADGVRQTGFINTASGKMFFDENSGKQLTGWITVNGATYYLDPSNDGALATGWVDDGNKRYYMNAEGQMQTGEIVVAGKTYILGENGEVQKGWTFNDAGEKVYADPEDGKIKTSALIEDNGNCYFLDAESKPMTDSWNTVNSANYYFGTDGKALKGWQEIDGKKYFFDDAAKSVSGLKVIGKKLYYFDNASGDGVHAGLFANGGKTIGAGTLGDLDFNANESGVLSSAEAHYFEIGGSVYYVDRNGNAVTGWIEKDGKRLYLDASTGEMATGVKKIGFKTYYFKPDGEDKGMLYTSGSVTVNGVNYKIRSDGSLVTGWSTGGYKPKPEDNSPGVHNDNQGNQGADPDGNAFDGQPIASLDDAAVTENTALQQVNATQADSAQAGASSKTSETSHEGSVHSGNTSGYVLNGSALNTSYVNGTDTYETMIGELNTTGTADAYSLSGVQVSDGSYLSDVTIMSAEGTVISVSTGTGNMMLFLLIFAVPVAAAGIVITRKCIKLAR